MVFIEAYGTDILRMMDDYSDALLKPTLELTTNVFKVELPSMSPAVSEQPSVDALLDYASSHEWFSRSEAEEAIGGSRSKVGSLLSSMVDEGLLERTGNGKSTRYGISKK